MYAQVFSSSAVMKKNSMTPRAIFATVIRYWGGCATQLGNLLALVEELGCFLQMSWPLRKGPFGAVRDIR